MDKDMKMPERIWAWCFIKEKQNDVIKGGWNDCEDRRESEYIRADIATSEADALRERVAQLEAAIKRQAGASETLRKLTLDEVAHLKEKDRSEYFAAKTLDIERGANAILTDENDALRAEVKRLRESMQATNGYLEKGLDKMAHNITREALKATP